MTVADHLPQTRFDVDECSRQPALPLTRVLSMIDLRAPFLDKGIDRFQAIRRLERSAQNPVHAEAMQREGLLQAFLKARSPDWFRSSSSPWSSSRAARASLYSGRS